MSWCSSLPLLAALLCLVNGCADTGVGSHCSGPADCPAGTECREGLCFSGGDADTDTDSDTDSSDEVQIDAGRMYRDVAALAADELLGRLPDTAGNEAALEMVETLFVELGLSPAGDSAGTAYRQDFGFESWSLRRPSMLELDGEPLTHGRDFVEFQYSAGGTVTAEIVFAGYGMTVPPFDQADHPGCSLDPATGYDDYAELDVKGKVVLLLRHGPGDDEALHNGCPSDPACRGGPCLWNFSTKAANARARGAAAMLVVNNYALDAGVEQGGALDRTTDDDDLPALFVARDKVEASLPELRSWADAIDASLAGGGRRTGVHATVDIDAGLYEGETENLLGVLPGADPVLKDEVVVLGAHIDHLGQDVLDGDIYNGADDNASGSAVMMELARALVSLDREPARTVLFASWNAEEMGLLGSCFYVQHPTLAVADMVAKFSIDMVGAGDGSGVYVHGGYSTGNAWIPELMAGSAAARGIAPVVSAAQALDASDHVCFEQAGVPAVLITSRGPHAYYHTPEDTIDTILEEDLEASAWLMWAVLEPLAMGTEAQYLTRRARAKLAPQREGEPMTRPQAVRR